MPVSAITRRGLTKVFGRFTAADGLNLDVKQGELFGLLGPNGAGKTTTVRMLGVGFDAIALDLVVLLLSSLVLLPIATLLSKRTM